MNTIKAIMAGIFFIVVATLLMQLAFILITVGYGILAKSYPFLNDMSGIFRYLIAIPIFIGIMFIGGYITAMIAKTKVLLHCSAVGVITIGGMMWSALENTSLTSTGLVLNILMFAAIIAGGLYQEKNE